MAKTVKKILELVVEKAGAKGLDRPNHCCWCVKGQIGSCGKIRKKCTLSYLHEDGFHYSFPEEKK